jgi:hypothetical protein
LQRLKEEEDFGSDFRTTDLASGAATREEFDDIMRNVIDEKIPPPPHPHERQMFRYVAPFQEEVAEVESKWYSIDSWQRDMGGWWCRGFSGLAL